MRAFALICTVLGLAFGLSACGGDATDSGDIDLDQLSGDRFGVPESVLERDDVGARGNGVLDDSKCVVGVVALYTDDEGVNAIVDQAQAVFPDTHAAFEGMEIKVG